MPPQPVVTRWGSWIEAAIFYSQNFDQVRTIVDSWESSNSLWYRAQNAFRSEGLINDLVEIMRYSAVLVRLKEIQCHRVGLRKGEQLVREFMKSLDEDDDVLAYLKNRLEKNGGFEEHFAKRVQSQSCSTC